jgi:hypothetical protein
MENLIYEDVCEVYIRDLVDPTNVFFLGLNSKNDITQKVTQTILKGGIGMKSVAVIQSDKAMDFTVATLTHSDIVWMMQSGSDILNGSYTVQKNEEIVCTGGTFTLTGTPVGTSCIVVDTQGVQSIGVIAEQVVTVTTPAPIEGNNYTLIYPSSVSGQMINFDSTLFPKSYYVEMHTICYTLDSVVFGDTFYIFNKAVPDGALSGTFDGGKNTGDTMKFTALAPDNSNIMGSAIVVPRVVVAG